MIQDIDETLKELLVQRGGVDTASIDIRFEMPNREWSAAITKPTINLFLYDIRENHELRSAQRAFRDNGLEAMKQRVRDMQRFAVSMYVLDAYDADVLGRDVPPEVLDAARNPVRDSEGFHYNRLRVRKISNGDGKPIYTAN